MKFNEQDRFDGLDEKIRIYATADYGDDEAGGDGYEGNELFDDEEEEEVVVSMAWRTMELSICWRTWSTICWTGAARR